MYPSVKIADLIRHHQTQMSACQLCLLHMGQIAQNRKLTLPFQDGLQILIKRGLAVIQQNPCDLIRLSEFHHSLYLSRQADADTRGPQQKNNRGFRQSRDLPGTSFRTAADSVIIAHGSLQKGQLTALLSEGSFHSLLSLQKKIQIFTRNAQQPSSEHGINIVRSALEFLCLDSPIRKGLEKSHGHHGLAASAAHGGDHDSLHAFSPLIRKTGFSARSRCRLPAFLLLLTAI